MKIKQQVMDKVSEGSVVQTKRWFYISKTLLFWLLMLTSTVIGIIASSIIIDSVALLIDSSIPSLLLVPLQVFWLVVLTLATTLGWRIAKNTHTLYRYRHATVILSSILISVVGGYFLSLTNAQNVISSSLYRHSAYYQALYVQQLNDTSEATFERILERERIRTLCLREDRTESCLPEMLLENSESDINP